MGACGTYSLLVDVACLLPLEQARSVDTLDLLLLPCIDTVGDEPVAISGRDKFLFILAIALLEAKFDRNFCVGMSCV